MKKMYFRYNAKVATFALLAIFVMSTSGCLQTRPDPAKNLIIINPLQQKGLRILVQKQGLTMPIMFGLCIHFTGNKTDLDMIADAGFKFIRTGLFWDVVEQVEGEYDFTNTGYDDLTDGCLSRGITPIYILGFSNKLYESNRSVKTDAGRKAFAAFARAAAQRYAGKGVFWEIWNEPNAERFWSPQPSIEDYYLLVKATVSEIKKVDHTAKVIGPAVVSFPFDWIEGSLKYGLLDQIDFFSIHPYLTNSTMPETSVWYFDQLRMLINKYNADNKYVPIISSEIGYSSFSGKEGITPDRQAIYLVRMFLINAWKNIPISMWYDWRDDGMDPENIEHNFGLIDQNNFLKPAYFAMKTLFNLLDGYIFLERLKLPDNDFFIFEFVNNSRKIYTYWTTKGPDEINLNLKEGNGSLVTIYGESKAVTWDNDGLQLTITDSPQYLIVDNK